jgi:hypothetical protein
MLYSQSMDIGFAHYPKTAGHSLTRWFRDIFPDARLVDPHPLYEVNHLPVRDSLERLGLVPRRDRSSGGRHRFTRAWKKMVGRLGWALPAGPDASTAACNPCTTRVIGVVREPFEMLVSLFEYWRSYDFREEPSQPLIQCARRQTFGEFLTMAVVDGQVQNYHDFFDMDGPASANTRLLDFNALEPALLQVCREFGLIVPETRLGLLNVGPSRQRDLHRYQTEAGTLMSEVRSHFRWYYEEGIHVMVTGCGPVAAADHRRRTRRKASTSLSGLGRKSRIDGGRDGSRWGMLAIAGGSAWPAAKEP